MSLSKEITLTKPPLNPPTEKVDVPKRVGIAKYTYWPSPQDTLNVFCLLFVNVLVSFIIKLLS